MTKHISKFEVRLLEAAIAVKASNKIIEQIDNGEDIPSKEMSILLNGARAIKLILGNKFNQLSFQDVQAIFALHESIGVEQNIPTVEEVLLVLGELIEKGLGEYRDMNDGYNDVNAVAGRNFSSLAIYNILITNHLAKDIEDAWHPSIEPTELGKAYFKVKNINA